MGGAAIVLIVVFFIATRSTGGSASDIIVPVNQGDFVVEVVVSGELEAKRSTKILGPQRLRNYRIYQVNIQKIIPEGTYVKKGEFVASLDPSELTTKVAEAQAAFDEEESEYVATKLDTALTMREARDELINLEYAVEEKELVLEQSQYEPPAKVKQAEIEVAKAQRAFTQAKENYEIKRQQNVAKMNGASAEFRQKKAWLDGILELQNDFTVLAPEDGMLIYHKDWGGRPVKEGSQISTWEPIVAQLPDLSEMNSTTYVNEVDIRRVKKGQRVFLGLDAFPDKQLTGVVTEVANVGEQRPNSDSKVFKVVVELDAVDETLRPGMTTSNKIITNSLADAISVPLECLHNFADSITYVYKRSGLGYVKQEVLVGETNADAAQIISGLVASDRLYLSMPSSDDGDIELLDELEGLRNKEELSSL